VAAVLVAALAAVGLVARWFRRAFRQLRNELGAARHQLAALATLTDLTETLCQLALLDETVATVARAAGGLGEAPAARLLAHLSRLREEIAAAGQPY